MSVVGCSPADATRRLTGARSTENYRGNVVIETHEYMYAARASPMEGAVPYSGKPGTGMIEERSHPSRTRRGLTEDIVCHNGVTSAALFQCGGLGPEECRGGLFIDRDKYVWLRTARVR